jgi:hypothetical protein
MGAFVEAFELLAAVEAVKVKTRIRRRRGYDGKMANQKKTSGAHSEHRESNPGLPATAAWIQIKASWPCAVHHVRIYYIWSGCGW